MCFLVQGAAFYLLPTSSDHRRNCWGTDLHTSLWIVASSTVFLVKCVCFIQSVIIGTPIETSYLFGVVFENECIDGWNEQNNYYLPIACVMQPLFLAYREGKSQDELCMEGWEGREFSVRRPARTTNLLPLCARVLCCGRVSTADNTNDFRYCRGKVLPRGVFLAKWQDCRNRL